MWNELDGHATMIKRNHATNARLVTAQRTFEDIQTGDRIGGDCAGGGGDGGGLRDDVEPLGVDQI